MFIEGVVSLVCKDSQGKFFLPPGSGTDKNLDACLLYILNDGARGSNVDVVQSREFTSA